MSLTELQLSDEVAKYYDDPLGFVLFAFPWGEPGPLRDYTGPDTWQLEALEDLGLEVRKRGFNGQTAVAPIRKAFSSGHGIGKGVLTGWLVCWIMSTRPFCQGTVTANSFPQLSTKTWASIQRWMKLCITAHWFDVGVERIRHRDYPESWFVSAQTCKPENSESFAGQHAANSSSFYIFDEACFREDTEVLTKEGWKRFSTLTPQDLALSMDPETGEACYEPIVHVHAFPYVGNLVGCHRKGASFSVTPNHRMYVRRWNQKKLSQFRWRNADDLRVGDNIYRRVLWKMPETEWFTIPAYRSTNQRPRSWGARVVPFTPFAELLGWYCSEGHLAKNGLNTSGVKELSGIGISNTDQKNLDVIEKLARSCGFNPRRYPKLIVINDRPLAEYLSTFGVGALSKRVPDCVRGAAAHQILAFLNAYIRGDGYAREKGWVIYTSSEVMSGDLQELALKAGFQAYVGKRQLAGKVANFGTHVGVSSVDGFVVRITKEKSDIQIRSWDLKPEPYTGMVYCAELRRHHLLLTRLDGYVMWSGNSNIPDVIWEVAEGGLTDGEPMWFVFGNPTRSSGRFHKACFGADREKWGAKIIDSRTCRFTNHVLHKEWVDEYGEDSDFVRVRVRGLPPRASDAQFISQDDVFEAQRRTDIEILPDEPLVCGLDIARGGLDNSVFRFRCGRDAVSIDPIRIPGEESRDSMRLVSVAVDLLGKEFKCRDGKIRKIAMLFVDETGVGGPIYDRLVQLGHGDRCMGVGFGRRAPDKGFANMRAYIWGKLRTWLGKGVISKDERLETDLTTPGFGHTAKDALLLESKESIKKRGGASPDDGDALALTFAADVVLQTPLETPESIMITSQFGSSPSAESNLRWMGV